MSSVHGIQKLLVAVDEGARWREALRAAVDLAGRLGGEIVLVHAIPSAHPEWGPEFGMVQPLELQQLDDELVTGVRGRIAAEAQEILDAEGYTRQRAADVLEIARGNAAKAVLDAARAHDAELILMGPHERRGFLDFGGTARAILAAAPCAAWTQPGRYEPVRRVLVPVDLSPHSLEALRSACSLALRLDAEVTVLHCFRAPELAYAPGISQPIPGPTYVVDELRASTRKGFEQEMAKFDFAGCRHQTRFVEGLPVQIVLELEPEYDLVAMGSHGRTGLAAAVLGNVAYGVLKAATRPVLAIRHPEREWLL